MSRILTQDIYVSLQSLSEKSFFGLALLIKTKRTLKHWLIKRQEQVGHSTTRNLSDLDTQVTRTELDECLDICMRHTCIACKFCKWRWAPMQFGTLSDSDQRPCKSVISDEATFRLSFPPFFHWDIWWSVFPYFLSTIFAQQRGPATEESY